MNESPEIIASEQVNITSLSDDILHIIMCMVFNFSDFIECYKIGKINKQLNRIVLNIIPTLTQINFYNTTFITWQRTDKLKQILKETKNITTLELKKITCINDVLLSLVYFLKDNTPLTTCRFNNLCQYSVRKTIKNKSAITCYFLKAFLTDTTYIELNFSNMDTVNDDYRIIPLTTYLKKNIKLTTLDLSCNEFNLMYLKSIIEALIINKTLTKLNLSNTYVNPFHIVKILKYNSTLTTLILSNTCIAMLNGVEKIAEILKTNTSLTTLDLSCNKIHSLGIIAIAEAVKINTTLTLLDLRCCNISVDGAKAITEALETNTRIQIITT